MRQTTRIALTGLAAGLLAAGAGLLAADAVSPKEEARKHIETLRSADATLFQKAKACQRLAIGGARAAVPALAALLSDEKLGHYARYGLEPIPDPTVDEALREALGKLK